jgi:p-hydroxybenzoate 3-monooxygenase
MTGPRSRRANPAGFAAGAEPTATPGGFAHGLRQGWITTLQNDPLFARWFAHAYVGVDPRESAP